MNRLRAWLALLGPAGVLGLGVLFFCIPFYVSALRPAERELAALRSTAERLHARGPFPVVAADQRVDELRRFYALLPPLDRLTDELEQVYALARDAQLDLMQGEYRLEARGMGPAAYHIMLPIRGTYEQVRAFVASVLNEKPTASVDALRLERKTIAETRIEAQVRLTLYFRPLDESVAR